MAADASKIYSGPATKVEVSPDGATWTDLGYMKANAVISWEPNKAELSDQNEVPLTGLGKISLDLVQTDNATLTILKSYKTTKAYVRITAVDGKTYQVSGIFLSTPIERPFQPGEPHKITVTGQRVTQNPDDWVTFPV